MARWAVTANKGAANVQSVATISPAAASPRRAKIYDWTLGSGATPGDNAFIHIAQRQTSVATGSAKTPNALDPADSLATTIIVLDTVTVDSVGLTANAFLFRKALNQRATFRWVAAPYGEILLPATAAAAVMFGLSAATTTTFDYDFHYEEL